MKKLLLVFAITAFAATVSFAQDQKDMKKDKLEWEKKIKDELKLNPEQAEKYDALNKEYDGKFESLKGDATLTAEAQKERKMSLKKEKEAKLMEILTPEQQTTYRAIMEKKKREMANKPGA